MRGVGTFVLAALCAFSFVVVCLGTCFAGDMGAGHSCCAGDEGVGVAARDCCLVVPGRGVAPQVVEAPAPAAIQVPPLAVLGTLVWPPLSAPLASAASPPLVLRI
jgi:hypothetical protein